MNQYAPNPYSFQQMHGLLQAQQRTIEDLQNQLARLQNDLSVMQKEPRTVEYNFDQLKIERLEGTLNIGLSPGKGMDALEDMSVNGNTVQPGSSPGQIGQPPQPPALLQTIQQGVNHYLNDGAYNDLVQIENQLQYPLDDPYRQFILQDIEKQVDPRIQHYYRKYCSNPNGENPETADAIINQVKSDVYRGMETFISKLKQGSESS